MTQIKFVARNCFFAMLFASSLAISFDGSVVNAAGLFAPFTMDSTDTLPKGVRNLTVATFTTDISDSKNGWASNVQVGSGFNKTVTWQDLVNSQKAGYQRDSLQGYVESKGYKMDQPVGNASGVVDIRLTGIVPVAAYGINDKLTVAVIVPVLYSNLNVSTAWTANQSFNQAIAKFASDGKYRRILQNKQQLQNVVNTDLASKNYGALPASDESHTDMGDITIAAKYRILKTDNYAIALVPKVILPTGRTADANKIIDIAPGSGVFDVGVSAVQSYIFNGRFALVQSFGFLEQLPGYLSRRVPEDPINTTSPDVDDNTYVKFGDIYSGQVGPKYKLTELFTIGGALSWQYKGADHYSGSKYDGSNYGYLSIDTEQVMFAGQAGLNFSTVPLYLAHAFEVPLEATLGYANVFSGRNVNTTEIYTLAVSMFF